MKIAAVEREAKVEINPQLPVESQCLSDSDRALKLRSTQCFPSLCGVNILT